MSRQVLLVEGMSCNGCAASVERALRTLDAIAEVQVDLASGRVTVDLAGNATVEQLVQAVRTAGFEVGGA